MRGLPVMTPHYSLITPRYSVLSRSFVQAVFFEL